MTTVRTSHTSRTTSYARHRPLGSPSRDATARVLALPAAQTAAPVSAESEANAVRSWEVRTNRRGVYRDHDDVETSPIHAPISQREGPICTATALPPRSAVCSSHGTAASVESNRFGRIATARTPGKCACDAGGVARLRDRNMPRTIPSAPITSCVTKRIVVAKPQFEAPGVSHGSLPVGLMPLSIRYCFSSRLASSAVAKGPSLAPSRVVKNHFPSTTK